MKILVCGGRDFDDRGFFRKKMFELFDWHGSPLNFVIIAGGASGADSLAEDFAIDEDIPYHIYRADWEKYGRAAGPIRNQQMLDIEKPSCVVAFPGGAGTEDMVRRAKKAGVQVIEVRREYTRIDAGTGIEYPLSDEDWPKN